jgi:acetyl esterase/lipase
MGIGMFLHRLAPPRPPKPDFYRTIDSEIAAMPGQITLHFYVPSDFNSQKKMHTNRPEMFGDEEGGGVPAQRRNSGIRKSIGSIGEVMRRRSSRGRRWGGYPVVINFHGGGFTLGSPYDDARWCGTVVQQLNAVVVSVDYRLAPEHPFPTAVEDGVDAVIWIHKHAAEFGIDVDKIMLSGFSSGANMAFTVPLRLYDEQTGFRREDEGIAEKEGADAGKVLDTVQEDNEAPQADGAPGSSTSHSGSSSSTKVPPEGETHDSQDTPSQPPSQSTKSPTMVSSQAIPELPQIKIRCIIPWYPSLDYTRTREERRATCVRADQELPSLFTNLFDDSYLHPPKDVSLDSPYLSPAVASTSLLRNALPQEIIMHTCEWDMLLDEGQMFYERLRGRDIGKNVNYTMVPGVPHGWDKAPNPLKPTPGVREHYLKACKAMRGVLGQRDGRDPSEGPAREHRPSMVR